MVTYTGLYRFLDERIKRANSAVPCSHEQRGTAGVASVKMGAKAANKCTLLGGDLVEKGHTREVAGSRAESTPNAWVAVVAGLGYKGRLRGLSGLNIRMSRVKYTQMWCEVTLPIIWSLSGLSGVRCASRA